jgi:hypothetical protein
MIEAGVFHQLINTLIKIIFSLNQILESVPSHDLVHSIKYNLLNKNNNNNNNNNKIIMVKLKTRVEIVITIIFQNIFLFENILK